MNEKQRRLIDFISQLSDPTPPPPAPVILESTEEILTPSAPAAPPKLTPDSVRSMLEKQRAAALEAAETEEILRPPATAGIEEGPAGPALLQAQPVPIERPITDRTIEVAVSATQKALNDEEITPEEQDVLEAIILPGKRPVLDITNGDMSPPPAGWEFLADYRPLVKEVLPSIGRINVPELTNVPYAGTGFFVGEGLLLTNRHVARLFVQGVGVGPKYLRFQPERTARMDPRYEVGDPNMLAGGDRFEVVESLLVHPYWDAALLRVRPVGDAKLPPALRLARRRPPNFGGGATPLVVVIGYPALDSRNNIEQQMNIFRRIFNRKRLMPGYLVGFGDVETSWKARLNAATHDASTLGGNSGSAVIDVESGLVLALHFGGRYLVANYGVPGWELAQDSRVVDLGVQFADYPGQAPGGDSGGPPTFAPSEATSAWLKTWDTVVPLQPEAVPAAEPAPADGAGGPPAAEQPAIPAAPDWFERISDAELVEAMRRDPARTERLIRATLLPDEADDLIGDLRQSLPPVATESVEEGVFDFLLGGGKTDPALPEIIFLHGIMGAHLAAYGGLGGRIWLSPLAFAAGGVATRLALADDGEHDQVANQILYPDGHVRLVYEKAARKWRMRGFVVHEFAFDWRKPIANAAERLHFFIESLRLERPAKKFALVGHSMGGLVAALYAVRHPEWSTRITQTIMLGSPLRGSFVPIEGLLGSYSLFPKAALADTRDEVKDYVAMARTLPGLLDMLPDPDIFPDAAPLYQRATWPADRAPAQIWLDQSRQLKRVLATSPILETARLIVSPGHPTVSSMTIIGGQLQTGRQNMPGDGTVPTRSAAASVPGVTVYRASHAHADLPREDAVIDAVESLLKNGRCDLPPLSQRERDDMTPIEEAVAEAIEEATAADLTQRMRSGIFTQRDVDYLLRNDHATLPGPVGPSAAGGGA